MKDKIREEHNFHNHYSFSNFPPPPSHHYSSHFNKTLPKHIVSLESIAVRSFKSEIKTRQMNHFRPQFRDSDVNLQTTISNFSNEYYDVIETPINNQGNILPPFLYTHRFDVSIKVEKPKCKMVLLIRGLCAVVVMSFFMSFVLYQHLCFFIFSFVILLVVWMDDSFIRNMIQIFIGSI